MIQIPDSLSVHDRYDVGQQLKHIVQDTFWYWMGLIIVFIVITWFKDIIKSVIAGMWWHSGRDFSLYQELEVDGKPSRLVNFGPRKTTFFDYEIEIITPEMVGQPHIKTGNVYPVMNEKLKELKITRPLGLLDLSKYVKTESTDS